jgi:hypothetical protein
MRVAQPIVLQVDVRRKPGQQALDVLEKVTRAQASIHKKDDPLETLR